MDVLGPRRRAVSEILAAVIMLAVTVVGFALIAPYLVQSTQTQASAIINDIRNGQVQQGQSLVLVYQHSNFSKADPSSGPYVIFGFLDYGSSPIQLKYVFVYNKNQTYQVDEYSLKDVATGVSTFCTSSPCGAMNPQQVSTLEVSGPQAETLENVLNSSSTYQLVLYSTDSLAYSFTGGPG